MIVKTAYGRVGLLGNPSDIDKIDDYSTTQ